MKVSLPVILLVLLLPGCKKSSDNIQLDLVIMAMTDGKWAVSSFVHNGTSITADFSSYRFKYYNNPKTVDAIKNGTVEFSGTWDGNAATNNTSANFPNANYPIQLINGNWNIIRNSWTYVEASQTNGAETKVMRLDKQ